MGSTRGSQTTFYIGRALRLGCFSFIADAIRSNEANMQRANALLSRWGTYVGVASRLTIGFRGPLVRAACLTPRTRAHTHCNMRSNIAAATAHTTRHRARERFHVRGVACGADARTSRPSDGACLVTLRARWVATLRARWVTLRARWVPLRARWVTPRTRWVTLRARWVTLRARWVTTLRAQSSLGDAKSSLGDQRYELAG